MICDKYLIEPMKGEPVFAKTKEECINIMFICWLHSNNVYAVYKRNAKGHFILAKDIDLDKEYSNFQNGEIVGVLKERRIDK